MNYTTFKLCLETMREDTLTELLQKDPDYQQHIKATTSAEKKFMQLDLTPQQHEIISSLLNAIDNTHLEHSTLSYLSGLIDCLKLLGRL